MRSTGTSPSTTSPASRPNGSSPSGSASSAARAGPFPPTPRATSACSPSASCSASAWRRPRPRGWHLAIEAYRWLPRPRRPLADPEAMTTGPEALVSEDRIEQLADAYSPDRPADVGTSRRASGGTAFMCVTDPDGMGVSLIQSNFHGIGSGISVDGAGFFLHDRGRGFTLERGHPNELAPGKRPLHTLSPTIWTTESGGLAAIIGTRGGFMQPQLIAQLASRVMGHDAARRWRWPPQMDGAAAPGGRIEGRPGTGRHRRDRGGPGTAGTRGGTPRRPQAGWGRCRSSGSVPMACGAAQIPRDTASAAVG